MKKLFALLMLLVHVAEFADSGVALGDV
jgi:hypothetical protein